MNKEEQPTRYTSGFYSGTQTWRLKSGAIHRMNGPAVIYSTGATAWYVNDVVVHTTPLELSIGQSIPWENESIAIVVNQINYMLFQVLLGNQKLYIFSLHDSRHKDTTFPDMTIP